jgi:hypothetical protein
LALAVPLSRFTALVGGGSAFFVRRATHHKFMNKKRKTLTIAALIVFVLAVIGFGYDLKQWLAIGIVYAGLFAVLDEPKAPPTKKSDE